MAEAAPCEVWFYHLERSTLEETLPPLLEKVLERGWRARLVSPDADRLEALDRHLWTYKPDSFLAHGMAGDADSSHHPVLLDVEAEPDPAEPPRQVLILLDDAEPPAAGLAGLARCMLLFDGRDEAAVQAARARWRAFKGEGATVSYWRQGERGWSRQA